MSPAQTAHIPPQNLEADDSFLGGKIYDGMGDKANLALRFLAERHGITEGVERTGAMLKLQEVLGVDAAEATRMLWHAYDPWRLWIPFASIGIASAVRPGWSPGRPPAPGTTGRRDSYRHMELGPASISSRVTTVAA